MYKVSPNLYRKDSKKRLLTLCVLRQLLLFSSDVRGVGAENPYIPLKWSIIAKIVVIRLASYLKIFHGTLN